MTDAALLAHIAKQPNGKTGLKHLFKELRIKGEDRRAIETALDRLAARGELIELNNGHYAVTSRSREFIAGRISMHRDGYGFLIPDHPIPGLSGDLYLARDRTLGAMNGDRAMARITHAGAQGRSEGEVVKILRRAHPTVVGQFTIHRRGLFVIPHDERLTDWIEIPEDMAIPDASSAANSQ
ncbi:MAG: ribonuclease R, partial [Acidobacteriota bacterium]|nr:ribonuclease R [Acidobacteriota bacterium]